MHFFTKVPWVNLLFSEKTVMTVSFRFKSDGGAPVRRCPRRTQQDVAPEVRKAHEGQPAPRQIPAVRVLQGTEFPSSDPAGEGAVHDNCDLPGH
jgi:hypothetical protein